MRAPVLLNLVELDLAGAFSAYQLFLVEFFVEKKPIEPKNRKPRRRAPQLFI
jgi:hypothetical protein